MVPTAVASRRYPVPSDVTIVVVPCAFTAKTVVASPPHCPDLPTMSIAVSRPPIPMPELTGDELLTTAAIRTTTTSRGR